MTQQGAAAAPGRTPQDYAIEHAECMATAGDRLLEAIEVLSAAELRREEHDDDDGTVADARDDVWSNVRRLNAAIYEFRKRRDRAPSLVDAQWLEEHERLADSYAAHCLGAEEHRTPISVKRKQAARAALLAHARTATRQADEALLRQAMEALELAQRDAGLDGFYAATDEVVDKAIAALRQRLDQPPAAAQGEAP